MLEVCLDHFHRFYEIRLHLREILVKVLQKHTFYHFMVSFIMNEEFEAVGGKFEVFIDERMIEQVREIRVVLKALLNLTIV